jgi:hypothetical protein
MATLSVVQIAALGAGKPAFNVPWHSALMQYAAQYSVAAGTRGAESVDPCMLAAIVNRESQGRNIFQIGMPHAPGCGVGLCQITAGVDWADPANPTFNGLSLFDTQSNLVIAATDFLQPALTAFPDARVYAFDAYNRGVQAVRDDLEAGRNPSLNSTNGNYGPSVFTDWINFLAASTGNAVDWSSYVG